MEGKCPVNVAVEESTVGNSGRVEVARVGGTRLDIVLFEEFHLVSVITGTGTAHLDKTLKQNTKCTIKFLIYVT